jgi:hypothetical protein
LNYSSLRLPFQEDEERSLPITAVFLGSTSNDGQQDEERSDEKQ